MRLNWLGAHLNFGRTSCLCATRRERNGRREEVKKEGEERKGGRRKTKRGKEGGSKKGGRGSGREEGGRQREGGGRRKRDEGGDAGKEVREEETEPKGWETDCNDLAFKLLYNLLVRLTPTPKCWGVIHLVASVWANGQLFCF